MVFFLAKIVYQIICGSGNHHPQFDEQLRLVAADDLSHAYEKATAIGRSGEERFLNNSGLPVRWKFVGVPALFSFNEATDGAELFSRTEEAADADLYISSLRQKEKRLQRSLTANPAAE